MSSLRVTSQNMCKKDWIWAVKMPQEWLKALISQRIKSLFHKRMLLTLRVPERMVVPILKALILKILKKRCTTPKITLHPNTLLCKDKSLPCKSMAKFLCPFWLNSIQKLKRCSKKAKLGKISSLSKRCRPLAIRPQRRIWWTELGLITPHKIRLIRRLRRQWLACRLEPQWANSNFTRLNKSSQTVVSRNKREEEPGRGFITRSCSRISSIRTN